MNISMIFLVIFGTCKAFPQFLIRSEPIYPHPAVLSNAAFEDTLPNELRNDFYKNPIIASALAKESLFLNKETQVIHREADKIPREKIYGVLHNAGLVRKR